MALVALMPTARPRGGDEVACSSEAAEPLQRKSIFRLESGAYRLGEDQQPKCHRAAIAFINSRLR